MVCSKCNILKEIDKFAWKNKALGIRRPFCKDCANAKLSRYYKDNPERYLGYELRRRYGLTLEQYYDLLDMQNHQCAICTNPLGMSNVDHNHETGNVRGILCINCNFLIGHAQDEPWILTKAAEYLVKHG